MTIASARREASGRVKVAPAEGPAFFVRAEYLRAVDARDIKSGAEFSSEGELDLLEAGLCCAAEEKARELVGRAEQSAAGLKRKLVRKGMGEKSVESAIEFLAREGVVSDERFARSWLANRAISHCEGRAKLSAALAARGIPRSVSSAALDEFFAERSESEICEKALRKCERLKKSADKTIMYLARQGFARKTIMRSMGARDDGCRPLA